MASPEDWRSALSGNVRFEHTQNIQDSMIAAGESFRAKAHQIASTAETEAYNNSDSLEDYTTKCNNLATNPPSPTISPIATPLIIPALPSFPSPPSKSATATTTIGPYHNCRLLSTTNVSEVLHHPDPTNPLALKVTTENRNIAPHNPAREAKILAALSHPNIISLKSSIQDQHSRNVLVFPYLPYTLTDILHPACTLTLPIILPILRDLFAGLTYLHAEGIIHRDIKPSNLLLASPTGPLQICDFGTAWHPTLSLSDEPADHKSLDVGTGCYRAPETLFGDRKYEPSLDMWSAGCVVAQCLRGKLGPIFESRGAAEDGNQLGLILSIFKTLGTPTPKTWPSAVRFKTPPFKWYAEFPAQPWESLIPAPASAAASDADAEKWNDVVALVKNMLIYEPADRLTAEGAEEALGWLIRGGMEGEQMLVWGEGRG